LTRKSSPTAKLSTKSGFAKSGVVYERKNIDIIEEEEGKE